MGSFRGTNQQKKKERKKKKGRHVSKENSRDCTNSLQTEIDIDLYGIVIKESP